MVDSQESSERGVSGQQTPQERVFVPGRVKPKTAPEGHYWVEIRGEDPTKPKNAISGHELRKIEPTPQGEVSLPPEKEHLRGQLIEQADFLDRIGTEQPAGQNPGSGSERGEEEQATTDASPGQTEPQTPFIRGSYTADIDLEAQEREDEQREQAVRKGMPILPEGPQEKPPSET